ncbi:fungal-specific transcription factor domain-containing protein [Mycotypha africana]|uniref:fungal-specific transcription factor domain-containing protein n=1 Tax=Mycotypha africana TaxID=64632 RepID=UPI002300B750|nr:fungal-specific transcription factor domain-containing protein [Mycotypha africana]KAI8979718.1 fungal-specific transcription factor domain-containing protein [Mycotypha africana]
MNDNFKRQRSVDSRSPSEPPDSAMNTGAGKKRVRITRACDYCRKKKVKCYFEPGQPCSNCVALGINCEFNDGAKKRGPPKGYIDALEKRIKKIEETLNSPASMAITEQQLPFRRTQSPSPAPTRSNSLLSSGTNTSNKRQQGTSYDKVQYLGDMSSFQFFSHKMHLNEKNDTWKGQHIRKFGKQVVLVDDGKDEDENVDIPQAQLLPHIKSIHYWIYSVTGVDRHTSDRLLKIYFANIHPVLPVVNKTRFLQQYRDKADTYPPSDLLNAMFGAAARFVECEALTQKSKSNRLPDSVWDVPIGWSDQFFEQAQMIISHSASTPTISKVQATILIHNHSGNLDSKSSACWLLGGHAIRLAQGLGLNRDCEEWDIPESEKQTRKRIWWSLYVADRFHSASLGRPITIRDEDNDVGYPDASASWKEILDEPDDDDISLDLSDTEPRFPSAMCRPSQTAGNVKIYQLFLELIKLAEILGRILQGLYTPKAKKIGLQQGSDAIVTQLDHELTEWRFGFPEALKKANFEDFDEKKGYLAPVTGAVLLCYFSLLILLHRPFIEASASGQKARVSYSSFRIGTSAAIRGIRIASQLSNRDFLMFPYSFSLYPVLQCCLILIYNTKNPDKRLSASAKADLVKGMTAISRLKIMSSTARRLHQLLKTIMNNNEIEVSVPASDMDDSTSVSNRSRDNSLDAMQIPAHTSDVGRGSLRQMQSPSQQHQQQTMLPPPPGKASSVIVKSPKELYNISQLPQYISEVIAPPNMDRLLSQTSAPSPTFMAEAFSLKQFGFNSMIGDPNQLDYTMQDVSAFSQMDALPPLPNMLNQQFENIPLQQQSLNTSAPSTQQQPQSLTNYLSANPSDAASNTTTNTTNTNTPPIQSYPILNNSNSEGLFRNNPNNPFFGIPSSMDWTEWNEWNQNNQRSTAWPPPF